MSIKSFIPLKPMGKDPILFSMEPEGKNSKGCAQTRQAWLAMNLSSEPLTALYTLLPVILYKHLNISPFQLSLFITLRPLLSLFSFYWSSHLLYFKNKLVPNLMGAWVIARLPFLLVYFFPNFWFLFFAAAFYQLFSKAGIPAWIEILKRNVPKKSREHLFSLYNIIGFLEGFGVSFVIGKALDADPASWGLLFCISAAIGLLSVFFQMRLKTPLEETGGQEKPQNRLLHPWKESFQMLRSRPDFARFQWCFMLGGSALMIMAPAFPIFYVDHLPLSYSNIALARFAFMAIGVLISSFIWKRGLSRFHINDLTKLVLVGFGLFSATLLLAQVNILFFYFAFFLYGIAQAGSQLLWNLSGTIFAEEKNSLPFTNVNIMALGVRGAVAPLLGGQLCEVWGAVPVLLLGTGMIIFGLFYMLLSRETRSYSHERKI